jgi:hypothetical protein
MRGFGTAFSRIERVETLSVEQFVGGYLQQNRPVLVTGAMREWSALTTWQPEALARRFGNEKVQVYGDLFRLAGISTLSEYLNRYFGREAEQQKSVPYVRWYCQLNEERRVPWADKIFDALHKDWRRPAFFPSNSFVLPYCDSSGSIDPTRDWFPARGLFISARNARTRLHVDPWCSDALLCQISGRKEFVMYDPSQAPYLTRGNQTVDIEAPDLRTFPDFTKARVAFQDVLDPGEIVLVPSGWFHHFHSVMDSVSLTWNFVHNCRLPVFIRYLLQGAGEKEVKQLEYAYSRLS